MECRGSGSPTVVVDAGLGMPADWMSELQKPLARQYMTCSYDRANMGSSGKAPRRELRLSSSATFISYSEQPMWRARTCSSATRLAGSSSNSTDAVILMRL